MANMVGITVHVKMTQTLTWTSLASLDTVGVVIMLVVLLVANTKMRVTLHT